MRITIKDREREIYLLVISNDKGVNRALYPGQATPKGFFPVGMLFKDGAYRKLTLDMRVPTLSWLEQLHSALVLKRPVRDYECKGYQIWGPEHIGDTQNRDKARRALVSWWLEDLDDSLRQYVPPFLLEEMVDVIKAGGGPLDAWDHANLALKIPAAQLDLLIGRLKK